MQKLLVSTLQYLITNIFRYSVPAGKPAFSANATIANADNGVSSAGLITTVHPHARAAAALEIICLNKFILQFINTQVCLF